MLALELLVPGPMGLILGVAPSWPAKACLVLLIGIICIMTNESGPTCQEHQ